MNTTVAVTSYPLLFSKIGPDVTKLTARFLSDSALYPLRQVCKKWHQDIFAFYEKKRNQLIDSWNKKFLDLGNQFIHSTHSGDKLYLRIVAISSRYLSINTLPPNNFFQWEDEMRLREIKDNAYITKLPDFKIEDNGYPLPKRIYDVSTFPQPDKDQNSYHYIFVGNETTASLKGFYRWNVSGQMRVDSQLHTSGHNLKEASGSLHVDDCRHRIDKWLIDVDESLGIAKIFYRYSESALLQLNHVQKVLLHKRTAIIQTVLKILIFKPEISLTIPIEIIRKDESLITASGDWVVTTTQSKDSIAFRIYNAHNCFLHTTIGSEKNNSFTQLFQQWFVINRNEESAALFHIPTCQRKEDIRKPHFEIGLKNSKDETPLKIKHVFMRSEAEIFVLYTSLHSQSYYGMMRYGQPSQEQPKAMHRIISAPSPTLPNCLVPLLERLFDLITWLWARFLSCFCKK